MRYIFIKIIFAKKCSRKYLILPLGLVFKLSNSFGILIGFVVAVSLKTMMDYYLYLK